MHVPGVRVLLGVLGVRLQARQAPLGHPRQVGHKYNLQPQGHVPLTTAEGHDVGQPSLEANQASNQNTSATAQSPSRW